MQRRRLPAAVMADAVAVDAAVERSRRDRSGALGDRGRNAGQCTCVLNPRRFNSRITWPPAAKASFIPCSSVGPMAKRLPGVFGSCRRSNRCHRGQRPGDLRPALAVSRSA